MSELKDIFRGIAVVVDDEINDDDSEVPRLMEQIEAENCHIIKFTALPKLEKLKSLGEAAFFILDWNLPSPALQAAVGDGTAGIRIPNTLRREGIKENIEFITEIRRFRFAPIFIFTNESVDSVKHELKQAKLFSDDATDHIFVKAKGELLATSIFDSIAEWVRSHPSAYVLKRWEAAYSATRNTFFTDFYELSHLWPVVLWDTYSKDSVSEAAELTAMIGRNIISRLAPVRFDSSILEAHRDSTSGAGVMDAKEVRKILEGERFVKDDKLQNTPSVGDVFKVKGDYYINIRPECDCVARDGAALDKVMLYLIRGSKATAPALVRLFNREHGHLSDHDAVTTVFAMFEGETVQFQMKDLVLREWGEIKDNRKGRLIPPYITKIQQRYAAYIQRVGLARIPDLAIPPAPEGPQIGDSSQPILQSEAGDPPNGSAMRIRSFLHGVIDRLIPGTSET